MIPLLFDVDGTLVDTMGAGKAALGEALRRTYGETGPIDEFDFHGRTDPAIVRGLLRAAGYDDADIDAQLSALWPVYLDRLEAELDRQSGRSAFLPGVEALLEAVGSDDRFACGLVTGNLEGGARLKLEAVDCFTAFTFGAYGSDSEDRDQLPAVALDRASERHGTTFAPETAVVIGDTPADIRCARAVGARVLAVATGRHSVFELADHRPDGIVRDLTETDKVTGFFIRE